MTQFALKTDNSYPPTIHIDSYPAIIASGASVPIAFLPMDILQNDFNATLKKQGVTTDYQGTVTGDIYTLHDVHADPFTYRNADFLVSTAANGFQGFILSLSFFGEGTKFIFKNTDVTLILPDDRPLDTDFIITPDDLSDSMRA